MKNILLVILLSIIPVVLFSQYRSSYDISEIYIEINITNENYYAEIKKLVFPEFGQVTALYKKAHFYDIGSGKYAIQLEHISDDMFRIVNTRYILKIRYASAYTFSRFDDCILDISGLGGTITLKE
jgi:hypothetical protein